MSKTFDLADGMASKAFAFDLADTMRRQGFDPDKGALFVLPQHMKERYANPPRFVRFSAIVVEPVMMQDPFHPSAK
jgi:hypothetical protein